MQKPNANLPVSVPMILGRLISAAFSDSVGKNAVRPLMRLLVKLSIQLAHGDALRVQNMHVDLRESLVF